MPLIYDLVFVYNNDHEYSGRADSDDIRSRLWYSNILEDPTTGTNLFCLASPK